MAQTKAQLIDGKGDAVVNNKLLVGTSSGRTVGNTAGSIQIEGVGDTALTITDNSNGSAGDSTWLTLARTRGTAVGGTTAVSSGDWLGNLDFAGHNGSTFNVAARISGQVDGTVSGGGAGDMPGRLVFSTTADGASSPTERARIGANGSFSIGGNAGTNNWRLFVVGSSNTDSTYAAVFRNSDANDLFFIRNDGGVSTGTALASPYYVTTASAANVFVTSAGYLQRSTSSARYKKDIETLENHYADAILNARPVWYKSIASGDTVHPEWGYWGFIAEEVAEIDPRLVFWKTHETKQDENGNTVEVELEEPIAEGVQYDRFVPHLLNLIKRQGEAIAELQAEVAALKGA